MILINSYSLSAADTDYLIGRGMADVTGPAYGNPMWGFSKEGQNTEGLHNRLKSRAFIFVDPKTQKRLLFASVDIGSIEHHVVLEVIDQLSKKYGDLYQLDNTILSATHTHAGPAGYWHSRVEFGLSGKFYKTHFDRIVSGIVASVEQAHKNILPGTILIGKGDVKLAGANRSMTAYGANPEGERNRYGSEMDLEMTLLRLQGTDSPMGLINWFAVHPTAMTYDNRLISGDHKGYASLSWEIDEGVRYESGNDFVAAFAQSTPGDVTPNLNLDNTGPGIDDFDSTRIIGQRQLDVAQQLFEQASERVSGPIDVRRLYVDLSDMTVKDAFTGAGDKMTCPSAYGYSFAAGSTEDGGGHFLFREGMTEYSWWRDILIDILIGAEAPAPSDKVCHYPKAILFQTGTGEPPIQSQIRSISLARLGSLAIIALPAEVTTMAARRIKETVRATLGPWVKHVVIAGYANGYAGYVTTPEEYDTQQYEGGHTLHGKWSLPAYQQKLVALARALEGGGNAPAGPEYDDWRGKSNSAEIVGDEPDSLPAGVSFGDALPLKQNAVILGETIVAEFWSGNPSAAYVDGDNYLQIERQSSSGWQRVHGDMDWSTIIRWREEEPGLLASVSWTVPKDTQLGVYRIKHFGKYRALDSTFVDFQGISALFEVIEE